MTDYIGRREDGSRDESKAAFDHIIRNEDGRNLDYEPPTQTNESRADVQPLNADPIKNVPGDGDTLKLTDPALKNDRNDTVVKGFSGISKHGIQAQGSFKGIEKHLEKYESVLRVGPSTRNENLSNQLKTTLTPNLKTAFVQEPIRSNRSVSCSADSHDSESFTHDDDDDDDDDDDYGQPTLPTSISEGIPRLDDQLNEGDKTESGHAHSELLLDSILRYGGAFAFRSMARSEVSLRPAVSDQHRTDTEVESSDIVLPEDAEPRQDAEKAIHDFEMVEPSLENRLAHSHSCPKIQVASPDSALCINIGYCGIINRWQPGSTVTFHTCRRSFPHETLAEHATLSLKDAADGWNRGRVGVTFQQVADNEPATFRLSYEQSQPKSTLLALAFLPPHPNDEKQQQPQLIVYSLAFERGYYSYLSNILCHELGHILGVRHWFAKARESKRSCVQFGQSDESSVMNYHPHAGDWSIQKSDYDDVQRFYAFKGTYYNTFPIVDVEPIRFNPF